MSARLFCGAFTLALVSSLGCSDAVPSEQRGAGGSGGQLGSAGGSGAGALGGSAGTSAIEPTAGTGGTAGSAGALSGGTGGGGNGAGGLGGAPNDDPTDLTLWTLAWSDEFNAANGSPPDPSKWAREVRGGTAGNHEAEYYTDALANSQQKDGTLVITALKETKDSYSYTSARLNTYKLYSAAYGRVETRAKMPTGQGLWPAFWMLGDNKFDAGVGWPNCGEIDIMEALGSDMQTNHGSLHGPGYSGGSDLTATIQLPGKPSLADDFHVYAVEWAPDSVKFFIDKTLYETRTPADVPAGHTWVYNHPFFLTLNLAVGATGSWPGPPNASTHFPAELLVDYVRVYSAK